MQTTRKLVFQGLLDPGKYVKTLANGIRTSFSTSSNLRNDKVYELRTYSVHVKDMKEMMSLSNQWMHLRMQHSKQIGYWLSEMGGLNDVVHIWEYDSLSHRAAVRAGMATDESWIANYLSKLTPMLVKQDNSLMKCLPGTDIKDPQAKGFYEIQHFDYDNTALADISKSLQSITRPNASLLGSFYTVVGIQSTGCQLWYHPDVDNLVKSPTDVNSVPGVKFGHNRLLLPTGWSTML